MTDLAKSLAGTDVPEAVRPTWFVDLVARVAVSAQIVLSGAVDDLQVFDGAGPGPALLNVEQSVARALDEAGIGLVLTWDLVHGLSAVFDRSRDEPHVPYTPGIEGGDEDATAAGRLLGPLWRRPAASTGVKDLPRILERVARSRDVRVGIVLTDASRLMQLPDAEAESYRLLLVAHDLAITAAPRPALVAGGRRLFNPVVWVVDREADLPHWLLTAPKVRVITVAAPVLAVRATAARAIVRGFPGGADLDADAFDRAVAGLAEESEGLTVHEMRAAGLLARDRDIPASDVRQAVRFLRSGHRVSPWRDRAIRARIAHAEETLSRAVLGQDAAVRKASAILARSALGLSGAHSTSHPSRPQGVLFLAGPTGVGKTELAKQIAELVFGRADALVRFDMSEFSAEHTQARLLGSPPGYVGHESGGELTNAVRDRPFSLLLFDEIEKAHGRILDKFLQILEDGRLTDGAGSTVHFGETLIVFTSNAGTLEPGADGRLRPIPLTTRPEEFERRVHAGIEKKFVEELNRPELLNRIGPRNVVVFQYLTPSIAREIADRDLDVAIERVREMTGVRVGLTADARRVVHSKVTREPVLVNGGRGVGNEIEEIVVNPLSGRVISCPSADEWRIDADGDDLAFDPRDGAR